MTDVESEAEAIDRVEDPVTVSSLVADLRELGLQAGDTVLVHSSMSSLGWVNGGPPAVIDALMEVLTPQGTLVMPGFSGQYSDPAGWEHPPVPDHWVDQIHASRPPFRPAITPTRGVGAIPECFRSYPDAVRSGHPEFSFVAWGADAETIVNDHSLDDGLGEESPLARIYERDGLVLQLGTGHETNTSLHLAEYRADIDIESVTTQLPILRDGERVVVESENVDIDSDDFPEIGADFEDALGLRTASVGAATATLVRQRELVDFAVDWMEANRD